MENEPRKALIILQSAGHTHSKAVLCEWMLDGQILTHLILEDSNVVWHNPPPPKKKQKQMFK